MPASRISTRLALGLFTALALFSPRAVAQKSDIDRLVTFGTSLSDTGNAFILLSRAENQSCGAPLNVPPYDTLDDLLVPTGAYAKGGHHFTNGATWVEGLARFLSLAGNARPALQNTGMEATNYAVARARASGSDPCIFNLPAQVATYLADFPQTSARTVVAIEMGSNEVRDALVAVAGSGNPADATPFIQDALGGLFFMINELYGHGARRFLVLNVPDIGKIPAVRSFGPGAVFVAGLISASYNAALAGVIQQLGGLPGIDVRLLDVYQILNDAVAQPGLYGFSNTTDACVTPNQPPFTCAKPDTYVFWDGIHPTRALHAIVAQQAIAVISAP